MNADLIKVLLALAACVVMLVRDRPRMDVVALLAMMALPMMGLMTVPEAFAGFGDPSVILIAALFVVGEGLVRTGVTYQVGEWLLKKADSSETRLLILLMLVVAGLGAVMSSTGVVAVFIPVVLGVSRKLKIHPGRLMMPLCFAGLTSGMMTLVGTPPNLVVDAALKQRGHAGFSFFAFTPLGLAVLSLGIGYMLLVRRWLVSDQSASATAVGRRGLSHFIEEYQLQKRGCRFRVSVRSPLVGAKLETLNLRQTHGANLISVERPGRLRSELLQPAGKTVLMEGDVLLVDFFAADNAAEFGEKMGLKRLPLRGHYFMERFNEVGMAEVAVPPESALIGKTVLEQRFRTQHGVSVVGLRRNGAALRTGILEEKLKMGDVLLVAGPWKAIRKLRGQIQNFLVLSLPAEMDEVAPAASRAPYALVALGIMMALMITGAVPKVTAALIACLLMGAFRCVDFKSAYRSIHWQSLVLIAGMMPFARALETTGGVEMAVNGLTAALGDAGPLAILAGVFALTAMIGLFISNTATAVLMTPIALGLAERLQVAPHAFGMTVAIAASAAFMTPVSSPVNTLVMAPGRYRFGDFVRVGVPFTLLVLVVTVVVVPWLFPVR